MIELKVLWLHQEFREHTSKQCGSTSRSFQFDATFLEATNYLEIKATIQLASLMNAFVISNLKEPKDTFGLEPPRTR